MALIDLIPTNLQAKVTEYAILSFILLIVLVGTWYSGFHYESDKWKDAINAANIKGVKINSAASAISAEVRVVYLDRIKTITLKGKDIIRNVPVYVDNKSDANCIINEGTVTILNNAAKNENVNADISASGIAANEAPANIKLSELNAEIINNYNTYNKVKEQLISLQNWVIEQEKNNPQPKSFLP
jgi:hypothetical protein